MDILHKISKVRLIQYTGLKKICWAINQIRTKTTAVDLAYRIHGPSPTPNCVPIFVLHDCLGSKKNWEWMCKKITVSTNMTVIAVDARNHGDSPHNVSHGYYDLAADVSQLISKFSVQRGIIIGHSMGGRTGMVLALSEPSKVASLIVVDISPISTSCSLKDFFPKTLDVLTTVDFKGLDLNKAQIAARNIIMENDLFHSEEDMQLVLMNIDKLPDKSIGWKYNLDSLKKNFNKIASFPTVSEKQFTGPTLFLGGKLSYSIPPEDVPGILKLFPKAHVLYVDGAGHNVHIDDPNTFFDTVMQFLYYNAMMQTA